MSQKPMIGNSGVSLEKYICDKIGAMDRRIEEKIVAS